MMVQDKAMRLVIFGVGGFGRELAFAARGITAQSGTELVFADDRPHAPIFGIPVLAPGDLNAQDRIILALGAPEARRRIAERLATARFETLIAPTALVGPEVVLGEGAVLSDHVTITASARIGRHFQCNLYSYVAHDCAIGDFVTFAPRVSCNGNVHIGDDCYVGTGATLRQGTADKPLLIGRGATIGMGAVVTKNVPEGATVIGNPARIMEGR